jgi:cytochrome subunit of sulfide dehydrogenase
MTSTLRLFCSIKAVAIVGLIGMTTSAVNAQTAQNPSYLAASCANCHGTDGNGQGPGSWPLAGKSKTYIAEQMAAFKAGTRQATIMHQISKGYSDEQIGLLAEYFSKQKPRQ